MGVCQSVCVWECESEPENPVAMSSFEVLVFADMTCGPILYLGTCNYVELEGMLKCNISARVYVCYNVWVQTQQPGFKLFLL